MQLYFKVNHVRTNRFKGLATSAISRSLFFQIYLIIFSKLVALNLPAPELNRYTQIKEHLAFDMLQ